MKFECPVCHNRFEEEPGEISCTVLCNKCGNAVSVPRQEQPRSKDIPALCVFGCLVVALFVTGYFAFGSIRMDLGLSSGTAPGPWMRDIEKRAKGLAGEVSKGIKILRGESRDSSSPLLKGYRLFRQRNYQGALAEFESVIERDPKNAEAYYWRGRTQISLQRPDQGEKDFKKAVRLKPDYAEAYDHLGWLAAKRGEVEEGIVYLTKSIEFKPQNGWALYNRSRLFYGKGDVERALQDAKQSCSLGYEDGCKAFKDYQKASREGA